MQYAGVNTGINISLGICLFWFFGLVGLAVATSVAAWANTGLLARRLMILNHFTPDARLKARLPRIIAAAAGMGVFLWGAQILVAPWLAGPYGLKVTALLALVIGGMAIYGGLALALGAARLSDLKAGFARRVPASETGAP
jgi:putative peptidoglycan lipid II flippase